MSAMVNRLKNELKEEKEKAQEEAEDLTQEMAELRYQLLQRVDEERELRARTEEVYLKRITELETQLRHSKQETALLLGQKQSAEVQAQSRNFELQNLKSALQEAKNVQNKLLQEKEQLENYMAAERQSLQSQLRISQEEFTSVSMKLRIADKNLEELGKTCSRLKEENEAIFLSMERKRVELQLKAIEEGIAQSDRISHLSDSKVLDHLRTSDQQKSYLLEGVSEMLELIASFKLQLFVLASEYQNLESRLQSKHQQSEARQDALEGMPYLDESCNDLNSDVIRDVACITDIEEATPWSDVSYCVTSTAHVFEEKPDTALANAQEGNATDAFNVDKFVRDLTQVSGSDFMNPTDLKEVEIEKTSLEAEVHINDRNSITSDCNLDPNCGQRQIEQTVVNMVDLVTEEMTKLLRILLKCSQFEKLEELNSLESRLQLWSNIPQKNLPDKIFGAGVLSEWVDLVIDLLVAYRQELSFAHQTCRNLESEVESLRSVEEQSHTLSKEARHAKNESAKIQMQFEAELALKEDMLQAVERELRARTSNLVEAHKTIAQLEACNKSFQDQIQQLEELFKNSKAGWESERQSLERSLAEQLVTMQGEKARTNKEIDRLERTLEEFRSRLAENEQELEELIHANNLNIDAVIAAKLRQLNLKLRDSQLAEAKLQAECNRLSGQVVQLQVKLQEAEWELEAENEHHVGALIQYEEERGLLEEKLEAGKQGLHSNIRALVHDGGQKRTPSHGVESWLDDAAGEELHYSIGEKKQMRELIEELKHSILEKDIFLSAQKEDLVFQKELNRKLMDQVDQLERELDSVREELLLCESQATDMESTIANLHEELLLERMKAEQAEADNERHARKQNEGYLQLKLSIDELLSNMQTELAESRKKEAEALDQVKKLGSELLLAKEQVKNSELRLQNVLKQFQDQLDAEREKLQSYVSAQEQAELHLLEQAEELNILKGERSTLQRLLVQVERERDDYRIAYMDLESQASRTRSRSMFFK
ncbi:hypothetical protein KP509_13G016200 [Ceratopteris richardii]|nr:hypothetical protein KP509_13G016200 [Ceratopteris richardii]